MVSDQRHWTICRLPGKQNSMNRSDLGGNMTTHQNNRKPVPVTDTAAICLQIDALTVLRGQRLVIDQLTISKSTVVYFNRGKWGWKINIVAQHAGDCQPSLAISRPFTWIYIGHADGLAGAISGRKNLQSWAAVNDITVQDADIEQALAGFDATAFCRYAGAIIVTGQRRRLALRAFADTTPSIWLLDEPHTGLDRDSQIQLETAINAHRGGRCGACRNSYRHDGICDNDLSGTRSSMMRPFTAQISRDLDIAWQNRQDVVVMLGFFIIIIALFPLAIGPQSAMLQSLSIPIIWIAALLSSLTGFDRLFAQDVRDGWLDQISLSALGLGWYAVAKAVAHWLTASLPLLMITLILALMLNIAPARLPALMVALLVGSMGLTLLGVIGAALAEGARRSSALISILVLPLAVPVLILVRWLPPRMMASSARI